MRIWKIPPCASTWSTRKNSRYRCITWAAWSVSVMSWSRPRSCIAWRMKVNRWCCWMILADSKRGSKVQSPVISCYVKRITAKPWSPLSLWSLHVPWWRGNLKTAASIYNAAHGKPPTEMRPQRSPVPPIISPPRCALRLLQIIWTSCAAWKARSRAAILLPSISLLNPPCAHRLPSMAEPAARRWIVSTPYFLFSTPCS